MSTSLKKMSNVAKIKLALTFAPVLILLIPTNEVFTSQMRLFFVITLIAIVSFCVESIPQTAAALAMPLAYIFFGIAPANVVLSPWMQYVPWATLGGLIMAVILERTGLLARIAYVCILRMGASYKGIVIGIAAVGCLGTLFVDLLVIPFAALTYGIVMAMEVKNTPTASGIMLAGAVGCLLPGMFKFTGILVPLGVGEAVTGPIPLLGFFEAWYYMMPMILNFIVAVVVLLFMFKPKESLSGRDFFEAKLKDLGKMSTDEKKVLAILILYFAFILGYKLTPFPINWGLGFIPILMAFPVIGAGTDEDMRKVNYGFILFVVACMGIGTTAVHLGIGGILKDLMLPLIAGKSYYVFFGLSWLLYFTCNFLMTPLAMMAAFTVPLVTIVMDLGLNPMALYFFIMMAVDQIVLPYEYALYLIGFAFGVMRLKDFVKFQVSKCIFSTFIMFAICLPWWKFTGFLYA